jgi:hypothetical protein
MFAEMPLDNRRVNPIEGSVAFRPPPAAGSMTTRLKRLNISSRAMVL